MPSGITSDPTHWRDVRGAALWYAKRGWAVVPLHTPQPDGSCSCLLGDRCGSNTGKHPRTSRGYLDASTDVDQIEEWWSIWPDANIGIRTGPDSDLLVLDVDPRNGGDETLESLIEEFGALPSTATVRTGGFGTHFYFRYPKGAKSGKLANGLDIKGDTGFVVAAPSLHLSGSRYEWIVKPPKRLPQPPSWLLTRKRTSTDLRGVRIPKIIKEGERHEWMVRVAGLMRHAGVSPDIILGSLVNISENHCKPPLPVEELETIAQSSANWDDAIPISSESPIRDTTDVGNAQRVEDTHGRDIRNVSGWGPTVWNTMRWERDVSNTAKYWVIERLSKILSEEQEEWPEEVKEARRKWARASQNKNRIDAAYHLLLEMPSLQARPEDFDTDPWLLNTLNGVIDLRTNTLLAHSRENMITKLAPVMYNPRAKCPTWESHLERIFDGNIALIGYMQRLLGYCITGKVTESVFPIFYGSGANGKSTLLRAIRNVLGPDYVNTAPTGFLMEKDGSDNHPTEVADLAGSRLVIASETKRGKRLNVEQMKQMTGEDRMKGRYMRQDFFEFPVTFKVVYMTNHRPRVDNPENATWRRIKLIPFTVQIPREEWDLEIDDKLKAEASGILNWLIDGCLQWQRNGLMEPDIVSAATASYRSDSDILGDFIRNRLVIDPSYRTSVNRLFLDYKAWAEDVGMTHLMSKRGLGTALREREEFVRVTQYVGNSQRMWKGVGLKVDVDAGKMLKTRRKRRSRT